MMPFRKDSITKSTPGRFAGNAGVFVLTRGLADCVSRKCGHGRDWQVNAMGRDPWDYLSAITHYTFPWAGRDKVIHSTVDTLVAGLAG